MRVSTDCLDPTRLAFVSAGIHAKSPPGPGGAIKMGPMNSVAKLRTFTSPSCPLAKGRGVDNLYDIEPRRSPHYFSRCVWLVVSVRWPIVELNDSHSASFPYTNNLVCCTDQLNWHHFSSHLISALSETDPLPKGR